jgi:hypothetical protein
VAGESNKPIPSKRRSIKVFPDIAPDPCSGILLKTGVPTMPRFKNGSRVQVLPTIFNRHNGFQGDITEVVAHKTGKQTLDKYEVQFANGERSVFWDIQLAPALDIVKDGLAASYIARK